MRASLALILVIAAATAEPRFAAAQKPFEGSITYDIRGGDQQMALTVTTRGAKARQWLDNPAAPEVSRANYQLVDFTTGEAMYVIPAMETYMVTKLKGFADAPPTSLRRREPRTSLPRGVRRRSPGSAAPSTCSRASPATSGA
jgi:hypothetical protein